MGGRFQELTSAAAVVLLSCSRLGAQSTPVDWPEVGRALGKTGALLPDGVYKVGLPRGDLHVTVAGVVVRPSLALGSWIALKQTGDSEAMLMGDLVLLETEVGPVLQKLAASGIEQTALHNHLLHESPRILYVHIAGRGTPVKLAAAVHAALLGTTTPLGPGTPAASPTVDGLDTAQIAQIIGFRGKVNGGVYQISVPRADQVSVDGIEIPPSMGIATAINLQPTAPGSAAITGDLVLLAAEVNPVIRVLQANGITITAIHSHMLNDVPHLFFLHYWADDDARKLAVGLRAALDQMNVKRPD